MTGVLYAFGQRRRFMAQRNERYQALDTHNTFYYDPYFVAWMLMGFVEQINLQKITYKYDNEGCEKMFM